MRKTAVGSLAALVLLAGGIFGYATLFAARPASAPPATVLVDLDRPDCPGKIVCPRTGELICRDRCPLNSEQHRERDAVPDCCRKGK